MGILRTDQQAYYATGGDHGNYQKINLTEIINNKKHLVYILRLL